MSNYTTSVSKDGAAVVSSYGDFKLMAYTVNAAQRALAEHGDAEVSVRVVEHDENGAESRILVNFSGDADTAAMVLKAKVAKERAARKAAGKETDEDAEATPENVQTVEADGGEATTEETTAGRRSRR